MNPKACGRRPALVTSIMMVEQVASTGEVEMLHRRLGVYVDDYGGAQQQSWNTAGKLK